MRIVSKAELRKMPRGTLYTDYHGKSGWPGGPDCIFLADLDYIEDFVYCDVNSPANSGSSQLFERQIEMDEKGIAYPVDLGSDREGLFDDTTRYLVWDEADVAAIAVRTAWFAEQQGEWNATTSYRIRRPDGSVQYQHDEEDARTSARASDVVERMYERHESEWRQV